MPLEIDIMRGAFPHYIKHRNAYFGENQIFSYNTFKDHYYHIPIDHPYEKIGDIP